MSLEVQNRSTAVLRDVVLLNQFDGWAIFVGDIAPCSALILHVADVADDYRNPDGFWEPELAIFRDPVGTWIRDEHALRPLADREIELAALAHALRFQVPMLARLQGDGSFTPMPRFPSKALVRTSVGDCGEG